MTQPLICAECGDDEATEGYPFCLDCLEAGHYFTFGSLFAGVGGFDAAFERAGMTCSWQAEIDPKGQKVLRRNFPHAHLYDDVRKVDGTAARVDLVCGGFPCQGLSRGGKRAGLDDPRSGLWWEFHRVLDELRPGWVVIENVPGLLTRRDPRGSDMGAVLRALGELGYGFAYRVLDSQWFGVAQRRRRLFVVGRLGDAAAPARVLLEQGSSSRNPRAHTPAGHGTARGVGEGAGAASEVTLWRKARRAANSDDFETWVESEATNTLNLFDIGDKRSTSLVVDEGGVRRLTPVEWERCQGFPDGWTEGASPRQRMEQMGNAVCVPVVEWIGRRIVADQQAVAA